MKRFVKLEYKVEQTGTKITLIHRRVVTPFFYVKLKTLAVTFEEWKQPFIWLPTPWFPICSKLPKDTYWFLGQWEYKVNGKSKQVKINKLEAIHQSYGVVKKIDGN